METKEFIYRVIGSAQSSDKVLEIWQCEMFGPEVFELVIYQRVHETGLYVAPFMQGMVRAYLKITVRITELQPPHK